MAGLYKTGHKAFTAWDYKKEVEELNRMSEQGWQLIKGKLFSQKYKKNENVVYKYQLDYQPKVEDLGRYIETFREQGWEYVNSTLNGWHYFRKLYDASLPAEEYEIYSDETSLKEMNNRWIRLGTAFSVILGLDALLMGSLLFNHFSIPRVILVVAIFIEFIWLLTGTLRMKKEKSSKKTFNAKYFLAFLFGSFLVYFLMSSARVDFEASTKAEYYDTVTKQQPVNWDEEEVSYPDFYSLEIDGKIAAPLTFELKNTKTGDVVFEDTLAPDADKSVSYRKHNFFLKTGTYSISFTNYEGGMMDLKFDWD